MAVHEKHQLCIQPSFQPQPAESATPSQRGSSATACHPCPSTPTPDSTRNPHHRPGVRQPGRLPASASVDGPLRRLPGPAVRRQSHPPCLLPPDPLDPRTLQHRSGHPRRNPTAPLSPHTRLRQPRTSGSLAATAAQRHSRMKSMRRKLFNRARLRVVVLPWSTALGNPSAAPLLGPTPTGRPSSPRGDLPPSLPTTLPSPRAHPPTR